MMFSDACLERLRPRLTRLYGERAPGCLERLVRLAEGYAERLGASPNSRWSERDVALITYGDQVQADGEPPLATLRQFLCDRGLDRLLRIVHLLPFFPYSSDDGFSVIDYHQVDPALGDWDDVAALGGHFDLMFDLVLNHVSRRSAWFEKYLAGEEPYTGYFVEADPAQDLTGVTRPRSTPLLTPFETSRGVRHVWTTFSADQVDLNFAEPEVLLEVVDALLSYIARGARIIRLDAIAYLWKQAGTPCIHLPETHEVVKLMRDVVEELAPGVLLLTETNVPHAENVSYFGAGDEAHMVYQFSLAPLLLDALLSGDAGPLRGWLDGLQPAPSGATYFNFTASHDGVGVRPLEGLLPPDRVERLVAQVEDRGGRVSTKQNPDGSDSPYELNITYFDALADVADSNCDPSPERHVRRFLASQAVMLALRGIPGIYFHSLVGTPNDQAGVARTGAARSINRRKFARSELEGLLADAGGPQAAVLAGYRQLLAARIAQPAFHPDADQEVLSAADDAVLAFVRISHDREQQVVVVANLGGERARFDLGRHGFQSGRDLLDRRAWEAEKFSATNWNSPTWSASDGSLELAPYQVVWLHADST